MRQVDRAVRPDREYVSELRDVELTNLQALADTYYLTLLDVPRRWGYCQLVTCQEPALAIALSLAAAARLRSSEGDANKEISVLRIPAGKEGFQYHAGVVTLINQRKRKFVKT